MRTTLDVNDALFKAAKKRATDEDKTLTELLEDALSRYLMPPASQRRFQMKLLTKKGPPISGVDFSDRDSLYEWLGEKR